MLSRPRPSLGGNSNGTRINSISRQKSQNNSQASSISNSNRYYYLLWILLFFIVSGLTLVLFHLHSKQFNTDELFHLFKRQQLQQQQQQQQQPILNSPVSSPTPLLRKEEKKSESTPSPSVSSFYPPKASEVTRKPYDSSYFNEIHFVHIPKCGGTTMTSVLRQIQCELNPIKNADCCLNPGFCDWHAHRRCEAIKGCINHFPNRKLIMKQSIPSFTVFREPTSRLLSAFFYRGHSPNNDFFQVRPEFKDIRDGKLPKVEFPEYIEMPEYQNIFTRMLGADSFPYRNITITEEIFQKAIDAVNSFHFIGLQEEFEISSRAFARDIVRNDSFVKIVKEREQDSNRQLKDQKKALKRNLTLMDRVRAVNHYDMKLYARAIERFCDLLKENYPDLYEQVKEHVSAFHFEENLRSEIDSLRSQIKEKKDAGLLEEARALQDLLREKVSNRYPSHSTSPDDYDAMIQERIRAHHEERRRAHKERYTSQASSYSKSGKKKGRKGEPAPKFTDSRALHQMDQSNRKADILRNKVNRGSSIFSADEIETYNQRIEDYLTAEEKVAEVLQAISDDYNKTRSMRKKEDRLKHLEGAKARKQKKHEEEFALREISRKKFFGINDELDSRLASSEL